MVFSREAHFILTMVAGNPVLYFGIFGLLFANHVTSSCVTEENQSKGMKETSCVNLVLISVPMKDIPPDTGILILSFNKLKAISTSTFKGMKQLVELDLSDNDLTSFKVDLPIALQELILANNSFKSIPDLSQLSSLTRLVLSNNQISSIPDSAFKGLKSLKVLELQKNTIDSLSGEVFNGLKNLDHLDLSWNNLLELPTHLISSLNRLEKFYLTENKLTNIPDDFFVGLDSLAYVYLDKNPWMCNCALQYFKEWVEENGHNIYYLSDGTPVNDEKSVLCSDTIPVIEFNTDACVIKGLGDVDQHIMPANEKVTQAQPTTAETTEPWITTMETTTAPFPKTTLASVPETTPVVTTEEHPTSVATTTKGRRLTTPIMTSTKQSETTPTTTAAWTTGNMTTKITTTEQRRPTTQTKEVTTPIIYSVTTLHPTSTLRTTVKAKPSFDMTTLMSTQKHPLTVSNVTTSAELTETSFMPTEIQPPAENSRAAAHGMSWLEYKILKNCCFLHLIIYILSILLLMAQMILSACLLVWTYTHLYKHYRALMEKLPNIRLIRYSLRAPVSEGEVLLVHDKALESNFSDQSSFGVTRMLVLEANSRDQQRIYTSAIL